MLSRTGWWCLAGGHMIVMAFLRLVALQLVRGIPNSELKLD